MKRLKTGIISFDIKLLFCIYHRIIIWGIQKNIEGEEKEALSIEETKNVKKRNRIHFFFYTFQH